jgi:anti-anti-sigma regulatory factor
MKSFEFGNLQITAEEKGDVCVFFWQGTSDNKELINALEPYYLEVISEAKNKKILIDFTKLKAMNSSSVPAIIGWMKALNEKRMDATIIYNKDSNWQRTSFRLLSGIGKGFNIEVNPS